MADGSDGSRARPSRVRWLVAWSLTGIALAALLWPGEAIPGWTPLSWDKALHAGLFFVLTVAWLRTGLGSLRVALLTGGLIVGSEVGQQLLPIGRSGDPFDAMADALGMLGALGLGRWLRLRRPSGPVDAAG